MKGNILAGDLRIQFYSLTSVLLSKIVFGRNIFRKIISGLETRQKTGRRKEVGSR